MENICTCDEPGLTHINRCGNCQKPIYLPEGNRSTGGFGRTEGLITTCTSSICPERTGGQCLMNMSAHTLKKIYDWGVEQGLKHTPRCIECDDAIIVGSCVPCRDKHMLTI